ncbi:MAG: hypothetical protein KJ955_03090, partial [Nanoarchaeota archaeon]|nr:hypothetical protein [Nanoarchaeota archaeon]
MEKLKEYQIPRGATLDVYFSPQGAYDAGLDAIKPKYTAGRAGQFAEARVAEAKALGRTDGPLNSNWAWVAEGVIYVPKDDRVLFVSEELNPGLKYAKQATDCHRSNLFREFTITDEHLERIIGDKSVRNMSRQDADKLAKAGISTK